MNMMEKTCGLSEGDSESLLAFAPACFFYMMRTGVPTDTRE